MKLAIAGLCLLGVIAAASAALLVSSLRISAASRRETMGQTDPTQIDVLVAARPLAPMTVLDGGMVTVMQMKSDHAPPGYISNSTEVVGKVLSAPMKAGEAFSDASFTPNSISQQIADVIPRGMCAVGISVSDCAGLDGLLVPGSTVDVLVALRDARSPGDSEDAKPQAAAVTLVEDVQVLAIEDQTIVSPSRPLGDILDPAAHDNNNTHRITLLVNTHQARTLELGMQQGTLSLALRNPLDSTQEASTAVWENTLVPASTGLAPLAVDRPQWTASVFHGDSVETKSFMMTDASRQ